LIFISGIPWIGAIVTHSDRHALRYEGQGRPDGLVGCGFLTPPSEAAENDIFRYLEGHLPAVHPLELPYPLADAGGAYEFLYALGDVLGDLGLGLEGGVKPFGSRPLRNFIKLFDAVLEGSEVLPVFC
jgi:hypothetical protein